MRMNEFDDDLKFKKRRTSDTVFIIKIVFIILTIFAILSSVLFISKMGSSDSYEIEEKGERYGNSEFIKYQGKISVAIPSGGRYFLNGVDINSFRTLNSEDRDTRIIGLDKNLENNISDKCHLPQYAGRNLHLPWENLGYISC